MNVVGIDEGPARVEVTEIDGPPLQVHQRGSTLTVTYDDLPWKGFLKWLDRKGWQRHAVVSLAVPHHTRVEVGVVGAGAVISGISGPTSVQVERDRIRSEVGEVMATFLTHYGQGQGRADDLAEAVRQVLDRDKTEEGP